MMTRPLLVLLAAGSSTRMGGGVKKEYLPLGGGTVLSQAAASFLRAAPFSAVVIAIPQGDEERARAALYAGPGMAGLLAGVRLRFVAGGRTRQESVYNALRLLAGEEGAAPEALVLVHDAARPFVTAGVICAVLAGAGEYGAAVPGVPPVDTQKEVAPDGSISRHLVRSSLAAVQTPQGFCFGALWSCHQLAARQDGGSLAEYTDDSAVWDAFPECTGGRRAHVVPGDVSNRKITFMQDVADGGEGAMIRVGLGTDVHRLTEGRRFLLGGVEIPAERGELGHSDGDVLLHAVADALLGASALGDIGSYFPPGDPRWKDADSAELLRAVWADVRRAGWRLENLDCVVECERPRILPWRQRVIESVAAILGEPAGRVFVKAKTGEGMDAVGRGEAVRAACTCLLRR